MKPLVIDVEGDTEGHVFNYKHKMYMLGLYNGKQSWQFPIEWDGKPYGHHIQEAQKIIDEHDLLIGANFKHDLLWTRRYGIKTQKHKVWCLQYAEYILSGQTWRMPDLDTASRARGGKGKIPWDWSNPFNTHPWEQAAGYNQRDLEEEYSLFLAQVKLLQTRPQLKRLIWNGCQDLQITAEMQWNGLQYDHELSIKRGTEILGTVSKCESVLRQLVPSPHVNWGSSEHLSAVLYGGKIKYTTKEPYLFTYANSKRPPATKTRSVGRAEEFPRLVEPLNGSKSAAKERLGKEIWSTDEGILARLKAPSGSLGAKIIETILEIRGLNKLVGTSYHGIPKLAIEMNWENGVLHGDLHHCVTQTGRLSSSKPNQQNIDYEVRTCIVSRYPLIGKGQR